MPYPNPMLPVKKKPVGPVVPTTNTQMKPQPTVRAPMQNPMAQQAPGGRPQGQAMRAPMPPGMPPAPRPAPVGGLSPYAGQGMKPQSPVGAPNPYGSGFKKPQSPVGVPDPYGDGQQTMGPPDPGERTIYKDPVGTMTDAVENSDPNHATRGQSTDSMYDEALRQLLSEGPRSTAEDEAQINAMLQQTVGAGQADLNARLGAGGFGTSGALGAMSGDMRAQAAREAADEMMGVRQGARDDYARDLGMGLGAYSDDRQADLAELAYQERLKMLQALLGEDPAPEATGVAGRIEDLGDKADDYADNPTGAFEEDVDKVDEKYDDVMPDGLGPKHTPNYYLLDLMKKNGLWT